MNPASGVRLVERRQYPVPHSETKGSRGSPQGRGLAKYDAVIENARVCAKGQGPKQAQNDEHCGGENCFRKRD
jgi:hypothetical protein